MRIMKKQKIINFFVTYIVTCSVFIGFCNTSVTFGKEKADKAAEKPVAKEISSQADVSDQHPEIEEGLSCNDCHEIKLDAATTATQVWLYGGYLKWNAGEGIMPQDKIWQHIVTLLGGAKQKRTFVLATALNNKPFTTTVDASLDPDKKVLYVYSEKGTSKLDHIKNNSSVSLNWHKEFKDFSQILCLQVVGKAELFEGTAKEYNEGLLTYEFEYAAAARKMSVEQWKTMMKQNMIMQKITIREVTFIDSSLRGTDYRSQQRWKRQ